MVVCFLIRFIIWDCELIFGMAVSVEILRAVAEGVSGTLWGGSAFDSAWFATISSPPICGW